jgi:hypothetical protein
MEKKGKTKLHFQEEKKAKTKPEKNQTAENTQ